MSASLTVLVAGATGQQGGAVARSLLERGQSVRALTRQPDSTAALALERLGAELIQGDFDDPASLERAADGVDATFAMCAPVEAGIEAEVRQGKNVAEAMKTAGVPHLVFSTVAAADQETGIPHFESKYEIERHVRSLGVPFTLLGPVWFMENWRSVWLPSLREGTLSTPLPPGRTLQQVALADLGGFVVSVLENRDRFLGKRLDVASDELSGERAAEILTRVTGRPIRYAVTPIEQVRAFSEDFATMYEWFDRVGYDADIDGLRRDCPEVGWHTFEEWSRAQDWGTFWE